MRDVTERPEAVACRSAELVGTSAERIVERTSQLLSDEAARESFRVGKKPLRRRACGGADRGPGAEAHNIRKSRPKLHRIAAMLTSAIHYSPQERGTHEALRHSTVNFGESAKTSCYDVEIPPPSRGGTGSSRVNCVPLPTLLCTRIVPRCASMTLRTVGKPNPDPPGFVE